MSNHSKDPNSNKPQEKFDIDFTPLREFMHQMDRFFNQSFKQINSHLHLRSIWVDMEETETDVIIKAELPGYTRDDIQIEIISNRLRIAVDEHTIIEDTKNNTRREYREQRERIVSLPFIIPEDETRASFHNGLLTITVSKKNSKRKYLDIND